MLWTAPSLLTVLLWLLLLCLLQHGYRLYCAGCLLSLPAGWLFSKVFLLSHCWALTALICPCWGVLVIFFFFFLFAVSVFDHSLCNDSCSCHLLPLCHHAFTVALVSQLVIACHYQMIVDFYWCTCCHCSRAITRAIASSTTDASILAPVSLAIASCHCPLLQSLTLCAHCTSAKATDVSTNIIAMINIVTFIKFCL